MGNLLSQELEEMKQQITILKHKLENQNIINDYLIYWYFNYLTISLN